MNDKEFITKLQNGNKIVLHQRNYPNVLIEITYTSNTEKPYYRFYDYLEAFDIYSKEKAIKKLDLLLSRGYVFSKSNYINDFTM